MQRRNPNTAQFAQGLTALMDNERISAAMLSEWTGISGVAIRNYRAGRSFPQRRNLMQIEAALRMPAAEIEQVKPVPKAKLEPVYRSAKTDAQYSRWFAAGTSILMHRKDVSTAELAGLIGVNVETMRVWLRAERSPKLASALQIAEVFRMPIEDIIRIGQRAEEKET